MRVCVCKVGGLGDTLTVAPLVAALREAGCLVTLLGGQAAILVAADRVVPVARARLSGPRGLAVVPGLVRRLGGQDAVLLSHDEATAVHVVAAVVARHRIGFAAGIARGECLLTERLPFHPDRPPADLALDLGRRLLGRDLPLRRVSPTARWDGGYGVVHPGGATPLQRWPAVSGLLPRLSAATGMPWRLVTAGNGLSLTQLADCLAGARAFVGAHSGPLHLAAALGVPHVAVAGPTAPAWDPPWPEVPGRILRAGLSCQPCGRLGAPARHCPLGLPPPCLTAWTEDAVVGAVREVLDA